MKKPYTIIVFFSVGDYTERDECWIANFTNKEDAFKCFKQKMEETGSNHFDDDKEMNDKFDELISTGSYFNCDDTSMLFVRHETCHDKFDEKIHSWN